MWIYHSLLTHMCVDGHLNCFHILDFMINAAVNIRGKFLCENVFPSLLVITIFWIWFISSKSSQNLIDIPVTLINCFLKDEIGTVREISGFPLGQVDPRRSNWVVTFCVTWLVTRVSCFKENFPVCFSSSKYSHLLFCFPMLWQMQQEAPARRRCPTLDFSYQSWKLIPQITQPQITCSNSTNGLRSRISKSYGHFMFNYKLKDFSKVAALFSVLTHKVTRVPVTRTLSLFKL